MSFGYGGNDHSHREYAQEGHGHYNDPEMYNLRRSVQEQREALRDRWNEAEEEIRDLRRDLDTAREEVAELRLQLVTLIGAHNEASAVYGRHLAGLHPLDQHIQPPGRTPEPEEEEELDLHDPD